MNQIYPIHWITLHGFIVFMGLSIYAIGSHTLRQRRHPSAAISWVLSLVLLPYIALPLYLIIGNRKVVANQAPIRRQQHSVPANGAKVPLVIAGSLAKAMGLEDAVSFERLTIHQNGQHAVQTLRNLINSAEHTVDLCTFILGRDVLGNEVAQLLMQRARAGIKIRLLIDGMGFYLGGRPKIDALRVAGVQVALFVPPLGSSLRGRTNLRNHRKMVITDGQWLWSGGRNMAAEYFEGDQASFRKSQPWIDLSFDLYGALAQQAQNRFEQDWAFATNVEPAKPLPHSKSSAISPDLTAQLVPSGPDQADDTIYALLLSGCFTAHSRILAVTPYFVPDQMLLLALALAARRGVAVDLLLPLKSNHYLADIARHASLRELAASGARVWMMPNMIHAKAVIIDNDMALVGSANLDERSLFLNYELMIAFYGPSIIENFADWIHSQKSSAAIYVPRGPSVVHELLEGAVRLVAFQL